MNPQTLFRALGTWRKFWGMGHLSESACVLQRLCCCGSAQAGGEKFPFNKY